MRRQVQGEQHGGQRSFIESCGSDYGTDIMILRLYCYVERPVRFSRVQEDTDRLVDRGHLASPWDRGEHRHFLRNGPGPNAGAAGGGAGSLGVSHGEWTALRQ